MILRTCQKDWFRSQDHIPSRNNVKNMVCVRYPQKQILLHEPIMGSALQFFPSVTEPQKRLKWCRLPYKRKTCVISKWLPMASRIHSKVFEDYDFVSFSSQKLHFYVWNTCVASTYLVRYSIGLLQCKSCFVTLRRKTSAVQNSIRNTQRLNSHS